MTTESVQTELEAERAQLQAEQAETNVRVARATIIIALGNLLGRILGLTREIALTNLFGASRAVDAFGFATSIPTSFYDLLIGGHVNSALVPVLSEVITRDGRKALWQLVSILSSLVTVILSALVLLLIVFAPQVVAIVGSGFDAEKMELATHLLRLIAPSLIFMSLFAVLSGTLYALREFTWPAFAGVVFNGCIVLATIFLSPPFQFAPTFNINAVPIRVEWIMARSPDAISAAAIGWLIGSLAQLGLQFFGMRGSSVWPSFQWNHPAVRKIGRLYVPVMLSLIMDTLVIRPFSLNLASQTGDGSIGYMNWATMLIQFPQGLVATAISIAILPTLSRQAALIASEGSRAFKDTLGLGLRLAITLILPAAVGLFVLAVPIIGLLFQHGAFNARDTMMTALTLRLYLIGLPFAALDLLFIYAFYARQDTLTPALIGMLSLGVYMAAAVALFPRFGLFSLMLADSAKHITHALVSAYLLMRRLDGLGGQRLGLTIGKAGLAAAAMGVVATVVTPPLTSLIGTSNLPREILLVMATGGVSVIVFVAMASVLRLDELGWIGGIVTRRLGFRR